MAAVTLSDLAINKVASLIQNEDDAELELHLRLAVRPGGCSGLSYEMFLDKKVADEDTVDVNSTLMSSVKTVIDPTSLQLLTGATLEYTDGLNAGFKVNNPNASRSCGCGQSFS